jgi:hypothetical protein
LGTYVATEQPYKSDGELLQCFKDNNNARFLVESIGAINKQSQISWA